MPNLNWLPVDCQHALRVLTISPAALKSSVPREVVGVANGMGPQCKHLLTLMPWRKQTARRRVEKCSMATAGLQYTYTVMWAQIAIHTHTHTHIHAHTSTAQGKCLKIVYTEAAVENKSKELSLTMALKWSTCMLALLSRVQHTHMHTHACIQRTLKCNCVVV